MRKRFIAGFLAIMTCTSFTVGCDDTTDTPAPVQQKQEEPVDTRTPEQKIVELSGHPRLYDDWKTTIEFYEKDDLDEKYVYIDGESPSKIKEDVLMSMYGDKKGLHEIHIYPTRIWGGINVNEALQHAKEYIPQNLNWLLTHRKKLTPKPDSKEQKTYYWLRYSENGQEGSSIKPQYNITFTEEDGCITEILFTRFPMSIFSDYRHKRNHVESEWEIQGL